MKLPTTGLITATTCAVVLLSLAWWLWPGDFAIIDDNGVPAKLTLFARPPLNVIDGGGAVIETLPPGTRVRILSTKVVPGSGATWPVVEVRTESGVVGWLDIHAFRQEESARIMKKYTPYASPQAQ